MYAPLEALLSKWYGQGEQQLAALFDATAALGSALLFIDELDALAGSRSREMHEASRRMLSVLLRRLDGVESSHATPLIAATNRPQDLDDALISRFDVRVPFAPPPAGARAAIFAHYAKHLSGGAQAQLGAQSDQMAGRDILNLCRSVERRWVCKRLRGESSGPELPPAAEYLSALADRAAQSTAT